MQRFMMIDVALPMLQAASRFLSCSSMGAMLNTTGIPVQVYGIAGLNGIRTLQAYPITRSAFPFLLPCLGQALGS